MKKNYKDLFLESASGFRMPFDLGANEELNITLGFGEQTHPKTGEKFYHEGTDFFCKNKDLYAVATGIIVGAGQEAVHGNYIVAKYGKYEVTYSHVAEAYTPYGTEVKAGEKIALSGDFLHMSVRFYEDIIDPHDFLLMLWANIEQLSAMGLDKQPATEKLGEKAIHTKYDMDKDEIMFMMLRWLPSYMNDLLTGAYTASARTENSLRNIYAKGAERNYFFEKLPDLGNPLGLTSRSLPLLEKVQNLLLDDFLGYMALKHNVFLPSWSESEKKKLSHQAEVDGQYEDPLANMVIDAQSYDIDRTASIYFNTSGNRCWTKAWFNGRKEGERSIEITRQQAIQFHNNEIDLDGWLSRFYPKQNSVYHKAIEQARSQLLGL